MLEGDEWKCQVDAPTYEEVLRHCHNKSRLLLEISGSNNPFPIEAFIGETANGGEFFSIRCNWGSTQWLRSSDVRIVAVLSSPEDKLGLLTQKQIDNLHRTMHEGTTHHFDVPIDEGDEDDN